MRNTPPPPGRGPGASWGAGREPPDRSYGGSSQPYRGGPMPPGPRPTPDPNATISRPMAPGPNPNSSFSPTPSRPRPDASLVRAPDGTIISSRKIATVRAPSIAPRERLWSGNLSRLWLGGAFSTLGDIVLGIGALIWFLQITRSFEDVAILLIAMAVPAAIMGMFGGAFIGLRDTRGLMRLIGFLRIALALVFVLMHFHTVVEMVWLLGFGLSLSSQMHAATRRATLATAVPVRARGLLASGDQVVAGILSVAAPALTILVYILNGERIFTISLGAAACYFLALINESQAEPLPEKILLQRDRADEERLESVWQGDEDEGDSTVLRAEQAEPVWQLTPAPTLRAALGDINDGLHLAGASSHALAALVGMLALTVVGGTLAVIEPYYVWSVLQQPPFMLGLVFTVAGLGAAVASAVVVEARAGGRLFFILGLAGSGVGLIVLVHATDMTHALVAVGICAAADVCAIRGGQITLLRHFVPVGQRAVAAALAALKGFGSLIGMIAAFALVSGTLAGHRLGPLAPVGMSNALIAGGVSLIVCAAVLALPMLLPNRMAAESDDALDELPYDDEEWDDDEDDPRGYSRPRRWHGDEDYDDRESTYSPAFRDDDPPPRRPYGRRS
jgi:hypothetical protein